MFSWYECSPIYTMRPMLLYQAGIWFVQWAKIAKHLNCAIVNKGLNKSLCSIHRFNMRFRTVHLLPAHASKSWFLIPNLQLCFDPWIYILYCTWLLHLSLCLPLHTLWILIVNLCILWFIVYIAPKLPCIMICFIFYMNYDLTFYELLLWIYILWFYILHCIWITCLYISSSFQIFYDL